jgi:mannose-6-phosphate isomerase-like protein (cupin superfamily)
MKDESRRPWGFYEILDDKNNHKVKRITVYPGKRLSLQSHDKRDEHWFILTGYANFTLDKNNTEIKFGDAVDIPRKSRHRIENIGKDNLIFIEIQTGDYFGEDDVKRYDDDFGRADL